MITDQNNISFSQMQNYAGYLSLSRSKFLYTNLPSIQLRLNYICNVSNCQINFPGYSHSVVSLFY